MFRAECASGIAGAAGAAGAAGLAALAAGRVIVVIDDSGAPGAINLMVRADRVSARAMSFIVRHGCGLVTVALPAARCIELQLPEMIVTEDSWRHRTVVMAVTVDATEDTSTGISAFDRAITARRLADAAATPEDFRRPGHVLVERVPNALQDLRATESLHPAVIGLAACGLAGAGAAMVRCELVDDDGELAGLSTALDFAACHDLEVLAFSDVRARALALLVAA